MSLLRKISPQTIKAVHSSLANERVLRDAQKIVEDMRKNGQRALQVWAKRLGDWQPGDKLIYSRADLKKAYGALPLAEKRVLQRTAARIEKFAKAQFQSVGDLEVKFTYGRAGHTFVPCKRVACYAPGGRYPLPSTVLMTVIPARVAGVETIWVGSPKPKKIMLAAAFVAGADFFLACGGAQTIAAFAYGAGRIPAVDMIVGPGNAWVTAAKKLVFGQVGIDSLAGPSEVLIIADHAARADWIAADLLAQAEHDPQARPMLISLSKSLVAKVETELKLQLKSLSTGVTARKALKNGFAVIVKNLTQAVEISDRISPEHLELHIRNAKKSAKRFANYGAIFIGEKSAEVFGDYGAGPNHVLPTAGSARFSSGLSVFNFLHLRTWLEVNNKSQAKAFAQDVIDLAQLEGLEAHMQAAKKRR